MSLKLLKTAVTTTKFSNTQKQTIKKLEESVGSDLTKYLIESYQVTPADYAKWLKVVVGYAKDEGMNLSKKNDFMDIAGAVLENDPQPIDADMQEAIMNTLWKNFQANKSHEKVQKVVRAKEEEEQLKYALDKMTNRGNSCTSKSMEDEEGDFDETNTHAHQWNNNSEYRTRLQNQMRDNFKSDGNRRNANLLQHVLGGRDPDTIPDELILKKLQQAASEIRDPQEYDRFDDLIYQYEQRVNNVEQEDEEKRKLGSTIYHSKTHGHYVRDQHGMVSLVAPNDPRVAKLPSNKKRDPYKGAFEDEESSLDEFDPRDEQMIQSGDQMKKSRDLEDFDPASIQNSKPRAFYAAEQEEVGKKDYASPFHNGQMVVCKKDKNTYKVEIPDGPGDSVGLLVNGRIKMYPSKDLEAVQAKEEEESISSTTPSFLHDLLTGANSAQHIKTLQDKIETDAANVWTTHHAKLPKNPHDKGSLAYKAWEKGIVKAAKNVWAPRPVEDESTRKMKASQNRLKKANKKK